MKTGFVKRPGMVTRVQKVVVTAVLAVSAVVGLSGSTAGAWSSEDGAVAVWGGLTENDGNYAQFNNETGWESLAVDAAGSMYLTGRFQSSVDFNASPTGTTTNWKKNKLVAPRPETLPGESKSAKTN